MRDKTVQVKLTNNLSSTAIKSSHIDTIQSAIESLDNLLSYAYSSVAIVLIVQKLWINHLKTAEHLNSFVLHCMLKTPIFPSYYHWPSRPHQTSCSHSIGLSQASVSLLCITSHPVLYIAGSRGSECP
jgi:hypothetical protein